MKKEKPCIEQRKTPYELGDFTVDLYKTHIVLYHGISKEFAKDGRVACCECDVGRVNIYFEDRHPGLGYIVHECTHAADFILDTIGAEMGTSQADSEVRAYLLEYIFSQVCVIYGYATKNRHILRQKGREQ